MSTTDEKSRRSTAQPSDSPTAAEPDPVSTVVRHGDDGGGSVAAFFFIGLAASLFVGWVIFPKLLYSKKKQPIDFNHAMHVDQVDNGCQSCHFFRSDGTFAGLPKLDTCTDCHEEVQGDSAEEKRFVSQYVDKDREVPWLVYSKQPACVFFSHAAHVRMAKMKCATCHGNIGESEHTRIYEQNRISGYSRDIWGRNISGFERHTWDSMKMADCAACHKRENVHQTSAQTGKGACFVCHK